LGNDTFTKRGKIQDKIQTSHSSTVADDSQNWRSYNKPVHYIALHIPLKKKTNKKIKSKQKKKKYFVVVAAVDKNILVGDIENKQEDNIQDKMIVALSLH